MGKRGSRGHRWQKSPVLIFCQGQVTEVQYFKAVKEYLGRSQFQIKGQRRSTAPTKAAEEGIREAKRLDCDEVYIVVDTDDFQDHQRAIKVCTNASNKHFRAHLVVSNPSFELWLLLLSNPHFAADLHRDQIAKTVREKRILGGTNGKHLLVELDGDAWLGSEIPSSRIAPLDALAPSPSSAVWHVVERMRKN